MTTLPPCNGPGQPGVDPDAAMVEVMTKTSPRSPPSRRVVVARIERGPARGTATAATPTLAQMIGQKLMVRMDGTTPSADSPRPDPARRGRRGDPVRVQHRVREPRSSRSRASSRPRPTAGGQPKLLIAVDQEGGSIKRIPWAPPTLSPPQMGRRPASRRPDPGREHRRPRSRPGHQRRPRARRRRPVSDVARSCTRPGRTWSFSARPTASALRRVRHRAASRRASCRR